MLALLALPAAGQSQETPRLEDRVTDKAAVFSPEQRSQLIAELAAYEEETSHQIAVLTVPTLSGESLEAFSLRVANAWGLGQKGRDNGILVTLALQERQVRIEVGEGLESRISDDAAQEIVQTEMIPSFRKGDYAGGLAKGIRRLMEMARPASNSFVECEVEAKVVKVERRETVNAEIAEALDLEKEMIGKLAVAATDITVLKATSKKGQEEDCARMVGQSGRAVIRYELANKELELAAGKVIQLHYWAFAGFAPYGVPGKEVWWVGKAGAAPPK